MDKIIKITPRQAAFIQNEAQKELNLVNKTVAPILEFENLSRCRHMNYGNPPQKVYKYLTISAVEQCVKNGNIRFSQPSMWNDGFEKRFYPDSCDFSKIITPEEQHVLTPRLFACCFTQNITSEAAWKIYSYNDNNVCVQLTINVEKFRLKLEDYAEKNNCKVYEGPMIYDYSDSEIRKLHLKEYHRHDILFGKFQLDNYLNLLRIKRSAFYYENEYRFFVVPQNQMDVAENYMYIPIDWNNVIDEIKIEAKNSKETKITFKNFLFTNGINIQPYEFDLNKMDEKVVIEK